MTINSLYNNHSLAAQYGSQTIQSFFSSVTAQGSGNEMWAFVAEQQNVKINMAFDKIGQKVIEDMAGVTAEYLSDKPELAEDYVLVIIDDPKKEGREVRAYHREDLVKDLEGEKKEKALERLKENPLLYHTSTKDLPDVSDDADLKGLVSDVQKFLDRNEKLVNILTREGYMPWSFE